MLFEYNWIQDLEAQLGQLNSGGATRRGLQENIYNFVFRRNVFVNTTHNFNIGVPNATFENNTFYRFSTQLAGINIGGSLRRGNPVNTVLKNNVFLEGGSNPTINSSSGFYSFTGVVLSAEVLIYEGGLEESVAKLVISDLVKNGYLINSNGSLTDKARDLTNINEFVLDQSLSQYKETIFDVLFKTATLDKKVLSSFYVNYNYVAGASSEGFPQKRNLDCGKGNSYLYYSKYSPEYYLFNFCESNGINGGNPKFKNISNPIGPDGIPFTDDDGLIPLAGSPLCNAGEGGSDIGAYNCQGDSVITTPRDTTPPVLSNGSPSGILQSSITETTLSLNTNEPAICKYSTTSKLSYSSIPNTFSITGGTSHSSIIKNLTPGTAYNYYIKCQDKEGNANSSDYTISFSIALPTIPSFIKGDLNNDNKVNSLDYSLLISKWFQTTNITKEDLNQDGRVDVRDLGIMMSSWKE